MHEYVIRGYINKQIRGHEYMLRGKISAYMKHEYVIHGYVNKTNT